MSIMPPIHGHSFMVSAGHEQAALAAYEVLEGGGNAIDAGVAAILTLGVTLSEQVNVAGVAPMLIHLAASDETFTVAGVGGWPRALNVEAYMKRHGGRIPLGVERSVVPAAPDACLKALERWGTMSFSDLARRAIRCAGDGIPAHQTMVDYLTAYQADMAQFPQNMAIWMPEGRLPRVGEIIVQADLARSLQYLCDEEQASSGAGRAAGLQGVRNAFYRGDLAQTILRHYQQQGGLLSAGDLSEFGCQILPPARRSYRVGGEALEVMTCGAWCQGPTLLETLAILEGIDLKAMGHGTAQYLHTVAEALKLAFADREAYLGDPDFVPVPVDILTSSDYGRAQANRIDSRKASPGMPAAGTVPGHSPYVAVADQRVSSARMSADTSIVAIIDRDGNAFCSTPSDPSWDVPVVPGTGMVVSSRGSQSWAVPGHPSVIAPGKRPRLTPNPCMARVKDKWIMPFGSPGGDSQVQANLQFLLNHALFGMDLQDAAEAPRIITHSHPDSFAPHASAPGKVSAEARVPEAVFDALAQRGHRMEWSAEWTYKAAAICAARKDLGTGRLSSAADPRRPHRAMGW